MIYTIPTKNIPNTQFAYRKSIGYQKTFEDRIQNDIKQNLRIIE